MALVFTSYISCKVLFESPKKIFTACWPLLNNQFPSNSCRFLLNILLKPFCLLCTLLFLHNRSKLCVLDQNLQYIFWRNPFWLLLTWRILLVLVFRNSCPPDLTVSGTTGLQLNQLFCHYPCLLVGYFKRLQYYSSCTYMLYTFQNAMSSLGSQYDLPEILNSTVKTLFVLLIFKYTTYY